jgi:Family of unknown function (DUF5522)
VLEELVKFNNMEKKEFIKDIDYYLEEGFVIFTEKYHKERGECCGNKCRHCPYEKPPIKGNKILEKDKKG